MAAALHHVGISSKHKGIEPLETQMLQPQSPEQFAEAESARAQVHQGTKAWEETSSILRGEMTSRQRYGHRGPESTCFRFCGPQNLLQVLSSTV